MDFNGFQWISWITDLQSNKRHYKNNTVLFLLVRSLCQDFNRHRITNVNDFDREMSGAEADRTIKESTLKSQNLIQDSSLSFYVDPC